MGLETPCDETDMLLFAAATTIQVGDRAKFLGLGLAIGEKTKGCRTTSLRSLQKKEQDSPTGRSDGSMAA